MLKMLIERNHEDNTAEHSALKGRMDQITLCLFGEDGRDGVVGDITVMKTRWSNMIAVVGVVVGVIASVVTAKITAVVIRGVGL
jgi:hypothetical protein